MGNRKQAGPRGSRIWGGLSEGTGVDQSMIYIEKPGTSIAS